MAKPFSKTLAESYCQITWLLFQGLNLCCGSHQRRGCRFLIIEFGSPTTKEWESNSPNLIFSHARFLCTVAEDNEQLKTYITTTADVTVSSPYWNKPGWPECCLGMYLHCRVPPEEFAFELFCFLKNFCNIFYFLIYKLHWILQRFPICMQNMPT